MRPACRWCTTPAMAGCCTSPRRMLASSWSRRRQRPRQQPASRQRWTGHSRRRCATQRGFPGVLPHRVWVLWAPALACVLRQATPAAAAGVKLGAVPGLRAYCATSSSAGHLQCRPPQPGTVRCGAGTCVSAQLSIACGTRRRVVFVAGTPCHAMWLAERHSVLCAWPCHAMPSSLFAWLQSAAGLHVHPPDTSVSRRGRSWRIVSIQ